MANTKNLVDKALLVRILQWFYLLVALILGSAFVWLKQLSLFQNYNIPDIAIYLLLSALIFYCFVLFISFFTQNTNLLILALVLIFFTTIGALLLLILSLPNAIEVISHPLPNCIKNLSLCNRHDGVIVATAFLLSVSVPALILNIITIFGAVKGISATD